MNPQLDPSQGLHLPQPAPHQPQQAAYAAQQTANPGLHQPTAAGQYAYMPPAPAMPQSAQPIQVPPANVSQQVSSHDSVQLDDPGTNLDEEWINKAREVVELHQSDPYNQSKELSRIKAEYLKARYNKEVKTSKDQSQ